MKIEGNIVDIYQRRVFTGSLEVENGIIVAVSESTATSANYILPGLTDSHIHIESSMVTPGAFAHEAVRHGTVCAVSDPHEIANVLGIEGVEFMINDASGVPFKFCFGAPSCVPATDFESSGARISSEEVKKLLKRNEIGYLSEMMNFPGVIYDDPEVLLKIEAARAEGKPIDGHAPGLTGPGLVKYAGAGISTDHECSSIEEALEKISLGIKILIREGSAARNLGALKDLFVSHPSMVMLCSDDLHPEMLLKGHINRLIARLVKDGYDLFDVVRAATVNPALHYGLDTGTLREGDKADFIIVDSPASMKVYETWINGNKVFDRGSVLFEYRPGFPVNRFSSSQIDEGSIRVQRKPGRMRIIEAFDGLLETKQILADPAGSLDSVILPQEGINKIVVKERYRDFPPTAAYIKGFGLRRGAFAGSIAHDSHNIVAVGVDDREIAAAVNEVIRMKGGLAVSQDGKVASLKLDIGGIMTSRSCNEVAEAYLDLSERVKSLGCTMSAPFMTLSFMSLLVIPELKLGDRGLFDVTKFCPVPLFEDPSPGDKGHDE
ncbi:MAG: adenine deaminase [Bacteroidales bacterium]|nr:adenine deaminase [Bacteroidales bacterium]